MTSLSLRNLATALVVAVPLAGVIACGDGGNGSRDAGPPPPPDAGDAGPDIPPGAILCDTDEDCEDDIECTSSFCNDRGFCSITLNNTSCQDGEFCNGQERCDPTDGCVSGALEACNDNDVCTLDSCDEENDECINVPRDFDQDGDPDQFCGGEDCNDRDPLVNSGISEICCDNRDNDCDGERDEGSSPTFPCVPDGSGMCGGPDHDSCTDALDVSAGGTFVLSSQGALPDYVGDFGNPIGFSCRTLSRPDLALRFTIEEPQGLTIRVNGTFRTDVSLHEATMDPDAFPEEICRARDTEIDCKRSLDQNFPFRRRSLDPGTYFVLLRDESFLGTSELIVDVEFGEPIDPPTNENCLPNSPIDVSEGGVFSGEFADVEDDVASVRCQSSFFDNHDLTYTFTTTESQNVDIRLSSALRTTMAFELRTACQVPDTGTGCSQGSVGFGGALAAKTFFQLPAGTYFIVVQGEDEVPFDLSVDFGPPTPPPPGETCANPIELTPGVSEMGRLSIRSDDHSQSCAGANRDAVYSFELDEERDVTVSVEGTTGINFFTSLRFDNCEEEDAEVACRFDGTNAFIRSRRLSAGTYFVIVESFATDTFPAEYTVTVDTFEPVEATDAADNDVCSDAVSVPRDGGFYTGSTIGLANDFEAYTCGGGAESEDAVFELELTEPRRVIASTEGSSFDTVVSLWSGDADDVCEGGIGPFDSDEIRECRDRTRLPRVVDRDLAAGTHWIVVDGWDTGSNGTYELDIAVLEP